MRDLPPVAQGSPAHPPGKHRPSRYDPRAGRRATVQDRPFTSLGELAGQRAAVRALLRDHWHFRRIAEEFCQDEAAQGVRYVEVTFTAAARGERLDDPQMPLEAVLEGLAAGAGRYGIQTRVILDHSRRRSVDRLWRSLKLATRYPQVIAIGLAGDESYPAAPFAEVFHAAREAGLHLVHHAGETADGQRLGGLDSRSRGTYRTRHPCVGGSRPGDRVAETPCAARGLPLLQCPARAGAVAGGAPAAAHGRGRSNGHREHRRGDVAGGGVPASPGVFGYSDTELANLARASVEGTSLLQG